MMLFDGFVALWKYGLSLTILFVSIIGWGLLCLRPFLHAERPGRWLALAPGIGIVALALLALSVALLAQFWSSIWKPASLVLAGLSLIGWFLFWHDQRALLRAQARGILYGVLLFLALLAARLVFMQSIIMPPYHDSPEHYELVQSLLFPIKAGEAFNFLLDSTVRYYHLGFHGLTAWWVSVAGLETASALSLLGQIFLVVYPFTLFALSDTLCRDRRFAWFAALLSAIGWSMPAFAVNWGKYPALAVIAAFPAVLALWISSRHSREKTALKYALLFVLTAGLAAMHTRVIVLLALAACCIGLSQLAVFPKRMPLWLSLLLTLAIVPVFYWLREPLLGRYFGFWYIIPLMVILGLPFAFSFSPKLSAAMGLFILGIYAASVTMLPGPLKAYSQFLLDRPFVDISLFLPLSGLVSLEFTGILFRLSSRPRLQSGTGAFFVGIIFISFSLQGSLRADHCCNYVDAGDLHALDWIKSETAPEAIVLISGYQMRNYQVATDGGAWVRALSGRNMNKVRYDLPWNKDSARALVCKPEWNEPYIYAGGQEFSFDRNLLYRPEWYEVVYEYGGTRIYKVHNCQNSRP